MRRTVLFSKPLDQLSHFFGKCLFYGFDYLSIFFPVYSVLD